MICAWPAPGWHYPNKTTPTRGNRSPPVIQQRHNYDFEYLLTRPSEVKCQGHIQLTVNGFLIAPHSNNLSPVSVSTQIAVGFYDLEYLLSRSSKVKGQDGLRLLTYGFLTVPHINYGSICYRLEERPADRPTDGPAVTVAYRSSQLRCGDLIIIPDLRYILYIVYIGRDIPAGYRDPDMHVYIGRDMPVQCR
jgi:hypothetical protein